MNNTASASDAEVCRWFSSVFAREVSEQAVAAYRFGAARPYLDAISRGCEIWEARAALEATILDWSDDGETARTLASEFGALFLVPGRSSAAPFASLHREGTLYGAAHDRMLARLEDAGLSLSVVADGPADHLSVMLEFLACLLDKGERKRAAGFVDSDIAPLARAVNEKIVENPIDSVFYGSIAQILVRFLARPEMCGEAGEAAVQQANG